MTKSRFVESRPLVTHCLIAIALASSLLFFSNCASTRQAKVCNSDYAYNAGYQDAKDGDEGKTRLPLGDACEAEYSPALYQKDYKTGYEKGKQEVCSSKNAIRISRLDALDARTDHPSLKKHQICIKDPKLGIEFEKSYLSNFSEIFCSKNSAKSLGERHSEKFEKLRTKKELLLHSCSSKKSDDFYYEYQRAYGRMMIAQCTSKAIFLKGERDARKDAPLSEGLDDIDRCPENTRDRLIAMYSEGYNGAKKNIREEELAEKRQKLLDQEKALLEQKISAEKEAQRTQILLEESFRRSVYFYQDGERIRSRCKIVGSFKDEAQVTVKNMGKSWVSFSGDWRISFYDGKQKFIDKKLSHEWVSVRNGETHQFTENFIPRDSHFCKAEYTGED